MKAIEGPLLIIGGAGCGLTLVICPSSSAPNLGSPIAIPPRFRRQRLGPNTGGLIGEAALALKSRADAADLELTIHPHPILSDSMPRRLMSSRARSPTLNCRGSEEMSAGHVQVTVTSPRRTRVADEPSAFRNRRSRGRVQ